MITPENNPNIPEDQWDENTTRDDSNENENTKTAGYVGPADREDNELDNGDTSSVSALDRSAFTRQPGRTNKPLGSSHEPGTV